MSDTWYVVPAQASPRPSVDRGADDALVVALGPGERRGGKRRRDNDRLKLGGQEK